MFALVVSPLTTHPFRGGAQGERGLGSGGYASLHYSRSVHSSCKRKGVDWSCVICSCDSHLFAGYQEKHRLSRPLADHGRGSSLGPGMLNTGGILLFCVMHGVHDIDAEASSPNTKSSNIFGTQYVACPGTGILPCVWLENWRNVPPKGRRGKEYVYVHRIRARWASLGLYEVSPVLGCCSCILCPPVQYSVVVWRTLT